MCYRRYAQCGTFDAKPLATCICCQCGSVIPSHRGSYLVDNPTGKSASNALASAFLKSVPSSKLTFEGVDREGLPKWYACSRCKLSNELPATYYVGEVLESNEHLKPVPLWNSNKPSCIDTLANNISLCTMFSTTVRDAGFSEWRHVQGEVNTTHKLDRHYYGIFGFLTVKDEDIDVFSDNPESANRIKTSLKWLKLNSHLYKSFYA